MIIQRRRFCIFRVSCLLILLVMGANIDKLNAEMVDGLNLAGDANFNCDSIACTTIPEHRWLSFPGGRLCLNPSGKSFVTTPTPSNLALDIGGYVGTKVLRLPGVLSVGLIDSSKPNSLATAQQTIWYPYKLELEATYSGGAALSGFDFFADEQSTLIRVLEISNAPNKELFLNGKVENGASVSWDDNDQVLLVHGTNYNYALDFVRLDGESQTPFSLVQKPVIEGASWRLELPINFSSASYGISFGFSTDQEGEAVAIHRAHSAFAQPVVTSLDGVKETFDHFLSKVPAPTEWGLHAVPTMGVTPERERQSYYMAWTFVYQSLIDVLPENPAYPYPQMSLGKGSLWAEGEPTSPATCGWESFLGIQWISFVEPDVAWQAYEGIMSRVDAAGKLGGESLPSRKAQTAWVLFQQKPDLNELATVYPAIKRYLLWREQNPRWIYDNYNTPDEKDLEFVVSWILDVQYAAQIADALGKHDEAVWWKSKTQPMIDNMRKWFFSDPKKLHQFYFTKSRVYSIPARNEVRPIMILTALSIPNQPEDMVMRLTNLFGKIHNPASGCDGFNNLKYPDNDLVAYGLIQYGMPVARPYIEAVLRDCIRGGEFAEQLVPGKDNAPVSNGVKPSLFNAMNIIEFTWLLNGARYDSGGVAVCKLPATGPSFTQN